MALLFPPLPSSSPFSSPSFFSSHSLLGMAMLYSPGQPRTCCQIRTVFKLVSSLWLLSPEFWDHRHGRHVQLSFLSFSFSLSFFPPFFFVLRLEKLEISKKLPVKEESPQIHIYMSPLLFVVCRPPFGQEGNLPETRASLCWQSWQLGTSRLFPSLTTVYFCQEKRKCVGSGSKHITPRTHIFQTEVLCSGLSRPLPRDSCWYVSLGSHSVICKEQDSHS